MVFSRKNQIIIAIATVIAGTSISFYFNSKKKSLTPEQAERVKNICFFYTYDKNNPGAHGGLGPTYHAEQLKNYENQFGPSGTKDIEEFCTTYDQK